MYTGSNKYSSLLVKLSPSLEKVKMVGPSVKDLLPRNVYGAYKQKEFEIKFVAVGVSSGSASFKVWPCK
jgi:hypothetical protein